MGLSIGVGRCLLQPHAKLFECFCSISTILSCTYFLVDLKNLAIFSNIESPSMWKGSQAGDNSIFFGCFFCGIAQDRVIRLQRFGKIDISFFAVGRVTASREVSCFELSQIIAVLTERLTLFRSATGKRLGKPSDDHGFFTFVIGKFVGLAITSF